MENKFKGKVVIVTGGSRGLGRAISLGFAAEGAKVVVASRKIESCKEVVQLIEKAGGEAMAQAAHTGKTDDLDALIEAAYSRFGRVDILVNNAGINVAFGLLSDVSTDAFDKMVDVNLKGPWYLASRLAPRMGAEEFDRRLARSSAPGAELLAAALARAQSAQVSGNREFLEAAGDLARSKRRFIHGRG